MDYSNVRHRRSKEEEKNVMIFSLERRAWEGGGWEVIFLYFVLFYSEISEYQIQQM